MKAIAISGVRKSEIIELLEPVVKVPYVKIKITLIPLCTEWKQWVEGKPSDCLGHEAVGVVVDSANSSRVKNGDRVVVMPQHSCGVCQLCISGDHIHCVNPPDALSACHSSTGDSTYAQFLLKEDFLLLPIPNDISDELAAMCLCGLGPTFNAMTQLQVGGLDTVLISGLGAVGCGAVINAKARGATVLALEMHPYRISLGKSLGVSEVLDPTDPELVTILKTLSGGRGVDKAVETSSAPSALALLGLLTKRKGQIACVGWAGEIPASTLVSKGLTVIGAWHWNHLRYSEEMWRTIRLSENLIKLFITHRFPLTKIQVAWELQKHWQLWKNISRSLELINMKKYKVALIGCGQRAPDHLDPYSVINEAEVVACSSRTDLAREAFANKYHLKAYRDPREMIHKEKPDLVHIITGPEVRVELLHLVSELGVPLVTVEKPLAVRVNDYFELLRLSQTTKTKIGVCHQFRYQPDFIKIKETLANGSLGRLKLLDISSGMNLVGQGTHVLNYGRALAGDSLVSKVLGTVTHWDENDKAHPAPESSTGTLEFENGVRAVWNSGPLAPRVGNPKTNWQHVRCEGFLERGTVKWEEFGNYHIHGNGKEPITNGSFQSGEGYEKKKKLAQAGFYQAMFDWHEGGKEPGISFRQSLHEVAVVFALYQSCLEHRILTLKQFEPRVDLIEKLMNL